MNRAPNPPESISSFVTQVWLDGFTPPPSLSVDEWADQYRILSSISTSEAGRWSTDRTPYLRDIMRELSPQSRTERTVLMKGAQLGGSEAGLNWVGYAVHHAPGPLLMVQPTVDLAKRFSKQRVAPLIETCPELAARVKESRSRDSGNTILMKEFPGGVLVITGANSAVGLRSMPVRYLFLDEVDSYPGDVDNEGDPVALAVQRAATFTNRKILLVSTPTVKGFSRIEAAYEESDKRVFVVPCDHCGGYSQLLWRDIRWGPDIYAAWWECPHCSGVHPEHRKPALLCKGYWEATAPGDGKTAGFHLSSLYSPWLTWGEIAAEHQSAKEDPVRLKAWVNTKLAETWEDREGERMDEEALMARREQYGPAIPAQVAVLTCGVDVQDDRLELELVGWGADEESWSCDYKILWGDPSGLGLWADLEGYLAQTFVHETLGGLRIEGTCIDTGGHHTQDAYAFCKGRERQRIWAIKGVAGKRPIWPKRASKNNKAKVNLFGIGVDAAKEAMFARLRKETTGAGYCHFPQDRDAAYFEQLTAERLRTRYVKGYAQRYWWKPDGRRNEALDCRVYAYAALHGLLSMALHLNKRVQALPVPDPAQTTEGRQRATVVVQPQHTTPRRSRRVIASRYL